MPSDVTMPKLSVIIPTYNPGEIIKPMLDSLVNQSMENFEVIIADDCSTEPYDDIIAAYEDKLTIVRTKTDGNGGPWKARQAGYDAAHGEWIAWGDQDDYFEPDVLGETIQAGEKAHAVFVRTDCNYVIDGQSAGDISFDTGMTHGKFFRRDFIDRSSLKYNPELKSHEDIYWMTKVFCVIARTHEQYLSLHEKTYNHVYNPYSVGNSEGKEYMSHHFPDYIGATGWVYIEEYDRHKYEIPKWFVKVNVVDVIVTAYIYQMALVFSKTERHRERNENAAGELIRSYKKHFHETNRDIYESAARDNGDYFWKKMEDSISVMPKFIPDTTFMDWLDRVSPDEEESIDE